MQRSLSFSLSPIWSAHVRSIPFSQQHSNKKEEEVLSRNASFLVPRSWDWVLRVITMAVLSKTFGDWSLSHNVDLKVLERKQCLVYGHSIKKTTYACCALKGKSAKNLRSSMWNLVPSFYVESIVLQKYIPSRNSCNLRSSNGIVIDCLYNSSSSGGDDLNGNSRVQQVLVDMVRIQIGKTRMTEFVDERSEHLRNIAKDASHEYDRIAFRTMKGLDAKGSRVLRQLEADASAIERDLRLARAEIEAQSRDFEEFQIRLAYSRNEGLFFKNLYRAPKGQIGNTSSWLNSEIKEVTIISPATNEGFGSGYRQLLYGSLSLVMISFIWSSSSAFVAGTCMRASKLATYGAVISALLTQLAFSKVIAGEVDPSEDSEDP